MYNKTSQNCETCPANQILYKGNCYTCPAGTYYDSTNHTCLKCPDDSFFNLTVKKCQPKCTNESIYDLLSNTCKCPQDKPFSNGTHCISCFLPKHWDPATSSCQGCPTGQYFNFESAKCLSCPTGTVLNETANSCTNVTCGPNQIFDASSGKCLNCPADSFVSNNTCLGCQGGYYDTSKKMCIKCKDGYTFNSTIMECQSICLGDTIYNPTKKYCECPIDRPNLSLSNQCVACTLPKYWDTNAKQCR